MILITSSSAGETTLLVKLCEQRQWPAYGCTTLREFVTLFEKNQPHVVVTRDRLEDGYSDDVLSETRNAIYPQRTRVIVLMGPDRISARDARQIALGADCVLHDPVPLELLFTYLAKFRTQVASASVGTEEPRISFQLGKVTVFPQEHRISRLGKTVHIAPQEVALLRLFSRRPGVVIPYAVLYHDLFGRKFSGDTTNCRVLLGKVAASFKQLKVNFRDHVEVIPKSGYRYLAEMAIPNRVDSHNRRPTMRKPTKPGTNSDH